MPRKIDRRDLSFAIGIPSSFLIDRPSAPSIESYALELAEPDGPESTAGKLGRPAQAGRIFLRPWHRNWQRTPWDQAESNVSILRGRTS